MHGWGIGCRKVPSKAGDGLWKIDFGSLPWVFVTVVYAMIWAFLIILSIVFAGWHFFRTLVHVM